MNKNMFFALVIVCITTHIIRTGYEILKHKKMIKPDKLSFIIVFTDMVLLWTSWFLVCRYDYNEIHFPAIVRYIAITLSGLGLIAFLTGLFTIKTLESYDGELITNGIYSVIRHPMYLGFILWLLGFPVYFESPIALILSVFFILNVLFWRSLEEKELEIRFPGYREYKRKTIF